MSGGVMAGGNVSIGGNVISNVGERYGQDKAQAIKEVAEYIEKSKSPAASALFESFNQELNKPQPDKSRLKSFWEGVENVLPSIATISESVAKIVSLFEH